MKLNFYEEFFSSDYELQVRNNDGNTIIDATLLSRKHGKNSVEVIRNIPRFVDEENYANNFGLQWSIYKSTQIDSINGKDYTARRFWENTKWEKSELNGKKVLEVGSGPGRFTEILLSAGATVISFDLSAAVEANYQNNGFHQNLFLFQGDVYNIPFEDQTFDFVFCYGVLQHTPNPDMALKCIYNKLRPGGKISVDYYRKFLFPNVWSTPKRFWRPLTKNLAPETLLKIVKTYIPFWINVDTTIRKIPKLGSVILALVPIPCWNYLDMGLTKQQRVEWAIMDTFDALGARYDYPESKKSLTKKIKRLNAEKINVFYGSNGVVGNFQKSRKTK